MITVAEERAMPQRATFGEIRILQRRADARCNRFTRGTSEHDEADKIWHDCNQALGEWKGVDMSGESGRLKQQLDASQRCADTIHRLLDVTDDQIQGLLKEAAKEKLRLADMRRGWLLEDRQDRLIATCCVALGLVPGADAAAARKHCGELTYVRWGHGTVSGALAVRV